VESSGGEIETDLDANNPMIFVDEMHFTNVLFNLLDNAVKYRHPDRPIKLKISTHTKDQNIVIGVQDNGLGIKREDLKRVFDRFYRVHTGNRHDVKGFGLGLAYVKSVIVSLKGTIHAESEIGEGTEFVITLPTI
jgi:two-component system phosphate regulon sensor histidine kinase PhoR